MSLINVKHQHVKGHEAFSCRRYENRSNWESIKPDTASTNMISIRCPSSNAMIQMRQNDTRRNDNRRKGEKRRQDQLKNKRKR